MRFITLAVWLLVGALASGQSVTLEKEYLGERGEWVLISPKFDGDALLWRWDPALIEVKPPVSWKIDTSLEKIFKARKDGRYKVEIWTAKVVGGKAAPSQIAMTWIVIGEPGPDPGPGPGPKPPEPIPDPVNKPPFPAEQFTVLIVHETSDKLPPAQKAITTSVLVREYLAKKCPKLADGQTAARIWDWNIDPSTDLPVFQEAWKVKPTRDKIPWILISSPTKGFSGPLPASVSDTLELLKKYAGP